MLRRWSALLLTALPLAAFCLAVSPATSAEAATPQPPSPAPAVDAALKTEGDAALAEAGERARAGDAAGALERLNAAFDLYRRAGDVDGQAGSLFAFALFYRQQQDYAAALDYYRRALEAGRQLNSPLFDAGTFLGIGDMQVLRMQQAEAIDSYTQALALLRQVGDRANQRIALTARGNSYYALGRYAEAASDYAEALAIARDLKDARSELLLLTVLGSTYKASGQHDQAMRYYPQALEAARAAGDRAAEGGILYDMGSIREDEREYSAALYAYRQAAPAAHEGSNPQLEGMALFGQGSALEGLGHNVEALTAYEASLAARRASGDRLGEALTLNNAGLLYASLGRSDDGLAALDEALNIALEEGVRNAQAKTLNNLGVLLSDRGAWAQALEAQREALDIALDLGDRAIEAAIRNNLGLTHDRQGQYAEAAGFYEQALAIHREMRNRAGEASVLNNLAGQDEAYGRYTQALARYQQALEVFRDRGDQAAAATALHNSAGIYQALGQYGRARESYEQVLEIRRQLGDRGGEARALGSLGSLYAGQGQFERSLEVHREALTCARATEDRPSAYAFLGNIGAALAELGRYDEALQAHEEALAGRRGLGDRPGEGESLAAIGVVHTYRGEFAAAISLFEQALAIEQELGDAPGEAVTWSNIAYARRQRGQLEQALDAYNRSIAIRERLRAGVSAEELRTSLAAGWRSIYEATVALQIELGKPEEAFATAERARARTFLDQLAGARLDVRQGADAGLLAQEGILRAELAQLDRRLRQERIRPSGQRDAALIRSVTDQLAARQHEYDELLVRLKVSNPQYAGLVSAEPLPLPEVQKLLRPDVTLLSYFVAGEQVLTFVVRHDAFEVLTLAPTATQMREAVRSYRDSLAILDGAEPAALAQLSAWLIAPLKDKVRTAVLGIVPHDALHYLPFAALPSTVSPSPGGSGDQWLKYLSDDYILFTLPSASVLPYLRAGTEASTGMPGATAQSAPDALPLLALAQPHAEGLPQLRFAGQEARDIAALYGVQPLIGDAATEAAFRAGAPGARLIHIAAHGQLNTTSPLFSRLYLAPDPGDPRDDGVLEVHEVYGLDLGRADMVTLSACRTQLGSRSDGDDIVGLSRAFIYAGAPTVVASLWSVDDEATAALMQAFYTHLKDGMGKAQALAAAQADLRRDEAHPQWAHPFYWAAFVLTGDPGTVEKLPEASRARPAWIARAAGGAAALIVAAIGFGAAISRRGRRRRSGERVTSAGCEPVTSKQADHRLTSLLALRLSESQGAALLSCAGVPRSRHGVPPLAGWRRLHPAHPELRRQKSPPV